MAGNKKPHVAPKKASTKSRASEKKAPEAVLITATKSTSTAKKTKIAPPPLTDLVHKFLIDHGYSKASEDMLSSKTANTWKNTGNGYCTLTDIFLEWRKADSLGNKLPEKVVDKHQNTTADDSSSASSEDSSSDSSDGSGSASEDSDEEMVDSNIILARSSPTTKRKRSGSSSSSSSSASSDLSDSSGSESQSDSNNKPAPKKTKRKSSVSSESDSSDPDSSSDESDESEVEIAANVPLPESGSESSSDSSSDSSSSSSSDSDSDSPAPEKKNVKSVIKPSLERKTSTDSSATLPPASPIKTKKRKASVSPKQETAADDSSEAQLKGGKRSKPTPKPFSRIPENQFVDPKFSSNAYVSYDYADRAHRDLVVTKGKGFTKEKNKKKRGSYRGGYIDIGGLNGIKFED